MRSSMNRSSTPPRSRTEPRPAMAWRRRALLLAAAGLPLVVIVPATGKSQGEPAGFIRQVADQALRILAARDRSEEERIAELERLLERATDLDLIAKLVLGSYWRKATPAQRQRYLELFRKMIRKQIAGNISRYDGQRIEIVGSHEIDDRDTMVSTLVHGVGNEAPYRVDWRVRRYNGRYLIIDVVAEGVSLLITKRKEFRDIVSSSGIEGLLAAMAKKVEGQEAAPQARS